jgi:hypothetical protein
MTPSNERKGTLRRSLSTFTTDAAGELDVLGHDGHTLGVDGCQVGILKQTNQVSLGGFLQSQDGRGLEAEIGLEVLSNFANQALEGELADEELCGLLVFTNLTKSHGTRAITMGLLHATGGGGGLASGCRRIRGKYKLGSKLGLC